MCCVVHTLVGGASALCVNPVEIQRRRSEGTAAVLCLIYTILLFCVQLLRYTVPT